MFDPYFYSYTYIWAWIHDKQSSLGYHYVYCPILFSYIDTDAIGF